MKRAVNDKTNTYRCSGRCSHLRVVILLSHSTRNTYWNCCIGDFSRFRNIADLQDGQAENVLCRNDVICIANSFLQIKYNFEYHTTYGLWYLFETENHYITVGYDGVVKYKKPYEFSK